MNTHSPQTDNNQRKAERISTSQPILIYHHRHEEPAKMIDISTQGSGFVMTDPISEGETIGVQFQLPNAPSPLKIDGEVVHSTKIRNQYLVGCLFKNMDSPHYQAIQDFISRHHQISY